MIKRVLVANLLILGLVVSICHADDAAVLPKGIWGVSINSTFFLPIDKRFNRDGKVEDIAKDFNVDLNSSIFSDLSLVEAGFGLPPGFASLGRSVVSFKWDIKEITFLLAYGVTNNLSIGINIPYAWQKNNVNASLDPSSATIGVNPGVPGGLAPIGFPGTTPPTTEDIQNLLASQGFKGIETWSNQGLKDIEVGSKYQYYKSDYWLLAFTGGVRLPTGKVDDTDNLVDRGFGSGTYSLLFRLHQDFIWQADMQAKPVGFYKPKTFIANTTFRYDLYLPDKQELRVCSIHNPICPDKAELSRDLGDVVEAEISGNYFLPLKGLSFSALYKYGQSSKDRFKEKGNLDVEALAVETDYTEHIYKISLSYTTLPLYLENRVPFPLDVSISYRDRFAGTNNVFNSQFIGFTIATYF